MNGAAPALTTALDRALVAEAIQAFDIYDRWRRTNGLPPASRLNALAKSWSAVVSSGQVGSLPTFGSASLHDVLVPAQLIDEKEAARLLGLSKSTVRRRAAAGELVAVRIGAAKRYRKADIEAYIESLTPEAP